MATQDVTDVDLGLRDVGFGMLTLGSVASTVFAQFIWIIVFDESGLDRVVSDLLFVVILPVVTVALVPTPVAAYLYTRRTTLAVGMGVLVAGVIIATYTVRFFALCGPGC